MPSTTSPRALNLFVRPIGFPAFRRAYWASVRRSGMRDEHLRGGLPAGRADDVERGVRLRRLWLEIELLPGRIDEGPINHLPSRVSSGLARRRWRDRHLLNIE